MEYKFTDLMGQVRMSLDQNQQEIAVLVNDENTLELDDIIRQKLAMSAKWLLERAPLELIDLHKPFIAANRLTGTAGTLTVALPSDWLRLHHVKVDTWDIPVKTVWPEGSEAAMMCRSKFPGIRPNAHRPAVVQGAEELTLYGSAGQVVQAEYIPLPKVEGNIMEWPVLLVDALIQLACGMVLETYKEFNVGGAYRQMAMDSAGIRPQPNENNRD